MKIKKNGKVINLTESDLKRIVKRVLKEQPDNPFDWASGWKSPIYCDNRKTLSYPEVRNYIKDCFADQILESYGKPDMIAGVATGGIALGALVAQELDVPFCYVRSQSKAHGLTNKIEGEISEGMSVVVIEDLISSGKSSLTAVEDLRNAGCKITGMAAIFSYGFEIANNNFKKANCPLLTLTNYKILIKQALTTNYITENDIQSLNQWREAPESWKQ